jgi:hypothetical protein
MVGVMSLAQVQGLHPQALRIHSLARDQQKWVPVLRPIARQRIKVAHDLNGEPVPTSPDHALEQAEERRENPREGTNEDCRPLPAGGFYRSIPHRDNAPSAQVMDGR